jgi:hypothetical protein
MASPIPIMTSPMTEAMVLNERSGEEWNGPTGMGGTDAAVASAAMPILARRAAVSLCCET